MNRIAHFEIQSNEPQLAAKFYSSVFGWKFERQADMPIEYWRIETQGIRGGLLKRPAPQPALEQGTNAFVCSVEVGCFDDVAANILKGGGQVALDKFAVLGVCWQGYFIDPDGNTFGIFQADKNAA